MSKITFHVVTIVSVVISLLIMSLFLFIMHEHAINGENKKIIYTENSISKSDIEEVGLPVIGFISPHHLVADDMIDDIFTSTAEANAKNKIDRIVLVSPNHFHEPGGLVMISDKNWSTKYGQLAIDKKFTQSVQNIDGVYVNNKAFKREHGVQGLLPFVQKHFDGVPVLPMMIELNTPKSILEEIARLLASEQITGNTLMILSSDFSHELTPQISELHDKTAISVIEHFDFENIYNLETDCVEGLYLLMKFAQLENHDNFELKDNSNSSEKYNHFFIGENTSYVTGQFVAHEVYKNENKTVSLLFGGDVMLDRIIRKKSDEAKVFQFTKKINRLFWSQDINMFNLEGPVTDNDSVSNVDMSNPNHFKFTFDEKQTKEFLKFNRIALVSIGNNHILNFGKEGIKQTVDFFENNDINFVGEPLEDFQVEKSILQKNINGRQFAFISYNDFASPNMEETLASIKKASEDNEHVIIFAHWGSEYSKVATESQREKAHKLINAGAMVIIGAHPHVIEPVETYKDGIIFYSLGNFIFDQGFSEDVRERLIVNMFMDVDDKIIFVLTPLMTNKQGQLELAKSSRRKKILKEMSENSIVTEKMKEQIIDGYIDVIL